jgi:hypothetical protein
VQTKQIMGLILIVGGIALAFWGYQVSATASSQLAEAFSDSLPDAVLYRYLAGAVFTGAGFFIIAKM